jgi:hypothetical protein
MLGMLGDLLEKLNSASRGFWLEALKRFLRKEDPWGSILSPVIRVDQLDGFRLENWFEEEGLSVVELDTRAFSLGELDLRDIRLEHMFRKGEAKSIDGETWLERLRKTGYTCLDARVFQHLWRNKDLIREEWYLETGRNVTHIYFPGTILCSPGGVRYVLSLRFSEGKWRWNMYGLSNPFFSNDLAAVLV